MHIARNCSTQRISLEVHRPVCPCVHLSVGASDHLCPAFTSISYKYSLLSYGRGKIPSPLVSRTRHYYTRPYICVWKLQVNYNISGIICDLLFRLFRPSLTLQRLTLPPPPPPLPLRAAIAAIAAISISTATISTDADAAAFSASVFARHLL